MSCKARVSSGLSSGLSSGPSSGRALACRGRLGSRDKHPDSPVVAGLFLPVFAPYQTHSRVGGYTPGGCYLGIGHAAAVVPRDTRADVVHGRPSGSPGE